MMMRIAMADTEIAMLSVLSGGSGPVFSPATTIVKSVCSRSFLAELIVITENNIGDTH